MAKQAKLNVVVMYLKLFWMGRNLGTGISTILAKTLLLPSLLPYCLNMFLYMIRIQRIEMFNII